jgi:hypothetical protein
MMLGRFPAECGASMSANTLLTFILAIAVRSGKCATGKSSDQDSTSNMTGWVISIIRQEIHADLVATRCQSARWLMRIS